MNSIKRSPQNIAASALAQSAGRRVLLSLAVLAVLWMAIVWAVAIP